MIEEISYKIYSCDDCGNDLPNKAEPPMYNFKEIRISFMLCYECKEKLIEWLT